MIAGEFIKRLKGKFPKDVNQYDIEDIENFLVELENDEIEKLYGNIIDSYEYKTFPSLAFIKKLYKGTTNFNSQTPSGNRYDDIIYNNNSVHSVWLLWPLKNIIDRLILISKVDEMSLTEMDFWGMFSVIYYEMRHMKEKEYNKAGIQDHLEYIFEQIKLGKNFHSIIDKENYNVKNPFLKKQNLNKEERFV